MTAAVTAVMMTEVSAAMSAECPDPSPVQGFPSLL